MIRYAGQDTGMCWVSECQREKELEFWLPLDVHRLWPMKCGWLWVAACQMKGEQAPSSPGITQTEPMLIPA